MDASTADAYEWKGIGAGIRKIPFSNDVISCWKEVVSLEMKELDRLNRALQILNGARDLIILLESSTLKEMPASVYVVFETVLEKAAYLLGDTADAAEQQLAGKYGR